jgi:hypothetical protein
MDPLAQMALAASFLRGPKEGQTTVATSTHDLAKTLPLAQGKSTLNPAALIQTSSAMSHLQAPYSEHDPQYKQWILEQNVAKQREKLNQGDIDGTHDKKPRAGRKKKDLLNPVIGVQNAYGYDNTPLVGPCTMDELRGESGMPVYYQEPIPIASSSFQRFNGAQLPTAHHRAEVITPFLSTPSTPSFESIVMDQSESDAHGNMLNSSNSTSPEKTGGEKKSVPNSGVLSR